MSTTTEFRAPGFLGIGAPRCGTTWLHFNLNSHPQLWVPPLKELHYWDILRPGSDQDYPDRDRSMTSLKIYWRWMHYRAILYRSFRGRIDLSWAVRYMTGFYSDRWYAKLFPTDRLAGEITPGYMMLPPHVIERIQAMNPDLKAVLLLRNPVSRAWSNVCHSLRAKVHSASVEQLRAMLDSQGSRLRGDYVRTINNWRGVLGERNVYIGFYDDLVARPRELLRGILQFLGVDDGDEHLPATIEREVNASRKRELPEVLVPHLYGLYIDQLRELESMLGGPVSKWLAKAEDAVRGAK